jgi:CTP synthase (UTP-ammonia lyase)
LGIEQADHEESSPDASTLLISRLSCSLVGTIEKVTLLPNSAAQEIYGQDAVPEQFACNYGLNSLYRDVFAGSELRVAGIGPEGEVRLVELPAHPFYIATLFLPQVRSSPGEPHPLIVAYLRAATS